MSEANATWDRPEVTRADVTSDTTGWWVRARTLAFISRTDASSSSPRSMRGTVAATCDFFIAIFNFFLYLAQHMRRDVFLDGFIIDRQEPDFAVCQTIVVNHPQCTVFLMSIIVKD
jgi:hypothetical protein